MNSKIYIPKKIKVGFQKRDDTYTGFLGYVIYLDDKNVWRKETSWNSWRSDDIDVMEFDNVPTEGFVLNKKVGGDRYGWNPRQTYTRVYDSRGFEFEIVIPNLLYILENTDCIKGKGLTGEMCYGFEGTSLILIPVSAPEYVAMKEFTSIQSQSVKKSELVVGNKYLTKQQEILTYIGKFPEWTSKYDRRNYNYIYSQSAPKFWFYRKNPSQYSTEYSFRTTSSLNFLATDIGEKDENIAFHLDLLEHQSNYSKVTYTKKEPVTIDVVQDMFYKYIYYPFQGKHYKYTYYGEKRGSILRLDEWNVPSPIKEQIPEYHSVKTPQEIVDLGFLIENQYLENGKINKK